MNPLLIIEPAARAAGSPLPNLKEGVAQEDSVLFASLVDVATAPPAVLIPPAEGEDAPAFTSSDGPEGDPPEGDPKDKPSKDDTPLPTAGMVAVAPQADGLKSTKDVLADPGRALPPRPQLGGNPKQIIDDALGSPSPAPPANGEGPASAKGSGLSVAQSMVEGRIAQLPKAAMLQAGVMQGARTEMPPDPNKSKQGERQLQQGAMSVQQSTPKPTAPLHQVPDQVTPRERKLQERATSVAPQLLSPSAPTLGPKTVAAVAQPAVALAQGMRVGEAEIYEHTVKASEHDGLLGLVGSDRPAAMATAASGVATAGPETARHIAHQIGTAIVQGNGKATEILLNPEELGRVRMSMSAVDGNLTLVVLADRPETQELLRRHIDVLAQEFRDLGYDSVSFSFNADGQSGTDGSNEESHEDTTVMMKQAADPEEAIAPMLSSGLDLRL